MPKFRRAMIGLALLGFGWPAAAQQVSSPATVTLRGTIWDFTSAHPNMQMDGFTIDRGAVERTLVNNRPVLRNENVRGYTTRADFDQWFQSVQGVNLAIPYELTLTRGADGMLSFADDFFWPIDGMGWTQASSAPGNPNGSEMPLPGNDGNNHNFFFTMHLEGTFTFQPTDTFQFRGDDDLWIFFDNNLGIDLSGVHAPAQASITGQQLIDRFQLSPGREYPLDIFFAERHTTGSSFRITTNLEIESAPPAEDCVTTPATEYLGIAETYMVPGNTDGSNDTNRPVNEQWLSRLGNGGHALVMPVVIRVQPPAADGSLRFRLCYSGFFQGCTDEATMTSLDGENLRVAVTGIPGWATLRYSHPQGTGAIDFSVLAANDAPILNGRVNRLP